jgi:L-malate glycosyltransferase
MKILRFYISLFPKKGGMEKHISCLSSLQDKDHPTTTFFNYGTKISNKDVRILSGIPLYKIHPAFIRFFIFYFFSILKLLSLQKKYDVIHIHGDWSSLMYASILKKIVSGTLVVFSFHGQFTSNFRHRVLLKYFLKNVNLVFATGYDSFKNIYKHKHMNVYFQPSGISDVFFKNNTNHLFNKSSRVVTVANFYTVKNLSFIMKIAKECPQLDFIIIGDGPEKKNLQYLIIENKLKNVLLRGYLSSELIIKECENSFCFLLTSFFEGTPTAILEAMALGLPIVTSSAGGIEALVKDYRNGFVIHDFDEKKYKNAIELLHFNSKLRQIIRNNNILLTKQFSWQNIANNITGIIKREYEKN